MEVNLANFVDHVLAFKCDEAKTPADEENVILNTYIQCFYNYYDNIYLCLLVCLSNISIASSICARKN